jgi:histidinol-phosphate aminotransferase
LRNFQSEHDLSENLGKSQKADEEDQNMAFQVPDYIKKLTPYVPGKPIEETRREYGLKKVIKLASNENPLGASSKAQKAVERAISELHRYPDSSGFYLKEALAKRLGVSTSKLILGNGSNEVIDQLIRTYCVPGDSIVTSKASFLAYKICAQIHGVKSHEVELNSELKFDVDEMISTVRKDVRARLVFVANPNNPTGTYLNAIELKKLLRGVASIRNGSVLLALDYAYWEYVTAKDLPDPHQFLDEYPNLVILRTFSKIYGLAGLRVGYGISSAEVITHLEKVRQPFNMNSLALAGAEASLNDSAFVRKACLNNQKGLRFWEETFIRNSVPFWRSQGNFILADVQTGLGKPGVEIYKDCLKKGVIFRPVANYGLERALRISIGTAEENEYAARILLSEKVKLRKKR